MLQYPNHSSQALCLFAKLLLAAILVAGCGGGGGSGSGSAPAKSSFTAGPIRGFGSVIVNGTRFDVSGARVADDDDEVHGEGDLKLGMVAEVEADGITVDNTGSHAHAKEIHFRSAIIGPVDAIDTSTRLLIVLGQTIDVSNTTVFDDRFPNGPFGIAVGDVLEIFGTLDMTTGHYRATRIAPKPDASFFKLRGVVTNLDTSARTFMIGNATISGVNLSNAQIPEGFANGMLVIAKLQTTQVNGAWVAIKLKSAVCQLAQHEEVEIEGRVTSVTSSTQFSVDGIAVDARAAQFRPEGATISLGAEVEVEGTASDGMIIATKVKIETQGEDEQEGFELHGAIEMLDTTSKTFVLHSVTVSYGGAVQFEHGSQNDIAQGGRIEVKGVLSNSGTSLQATKINFEH
jgi:hypothetical protein